MTIVNEQPFMQNGTLTNLSPPLQEQEAEGIIQQLVSNEIAHFDLATHLFLPNKLMTHTKEVGVNPLVDSASYLFSIIGKLAHIPSYRYLNKLHDELVQEIKSFKKAVKNCYHNAHHMIEHLPIACYALCIALDNTISNLSWGDDQKWQQHYSLINTFYPDAISRENFFVILERMVHHPAIYIDVMEFIYLCLSLGNKGRQSTMFAYHEQEYIINTLYKHIRIYRGDFPKTLSPFPLKSRLAKVLVVREYSIFNWIIPLLLVSVIIVGCLLLTNHLFERSTAYIQHHLIQIAKSNRLLTVNTL